MDKFLSLMLGTTDVPTYAAYFIFALIGSIISLYIKSLKRNKASKSTPYNFSWRFLVQDNLLRLVAGFFLTFLAFRFSAEFVGIELTMWSGVLIGATTDRLVGLFQALQDKARSK